MAEEEEQDGLQYVGAKVPVAWIPHMDRVARARRWARSEVIREAIRQFVGIPEDAIEAKAS